MIHTGDCVEVMAELPADSVDAIVTDPPYLIGFMGKVWDGPASFVERKSARRADSFEAAHGNHNPTNSADASRTRRSENHKAQAWHEAWAREAFRVAKPGAHLLAFGGTRTYHRLASAIEDAGWEIRDCLVWAYASGFPKSLDVSKAIDKAAGAEREVVGKAGYRRGGDGYPKGNSFEQPTLDRTPEITAPATPDAEKWDGWGTALKPAWEPIVMARKPLRGTVAANVLAHGTGALNIHATRIPGAWTTWRREDGSINPSAGFGDEYVGADTRPEDVRNPEHPAGRWPANLLLTDPIFDGDTPGVVGGGTSESGSRNGSYGGSEAWSGQYGPVSDSITGDSGTYSRFFLIPKSSRSDREPVLRGQLPEVVMDIAGQNTPEGREGRGVSPIVPARENAHPTVKPIDLMRHLVRLVTPPGGTVLDCFAGSGTTAIACEMEGFSWVAIEKEAEYVQIMEARLNGVQRGMGLVI